MCNKYLQHLATSSTRHSFASHRLVFHPMQPMSAPHCTTTRWPMHKFGGESSSVESGLSSTSSLFNSLMRKSLNSPFRLWAGSFSRSEVLSYLYLPSSFKLFLSLFLLVIQLAKEIVLDLIGRIKAPDPWKGHTSRCHLGYIYTDPQMMVKAYPHTTVWVPIGCSTVLG